MFVVEDAKCRFYVLYDLLFILFIKVVFLFSFRFLVDVFISNNKQSACFYEKRDNAFFLFSTILLSTFIY